MTPRAGPIRRLYSALSRSRVEGHPVPSGAGVAAREPRVAAREPRVTASEPRVTAPEPRVTAPEPRVTADEPRETICAPKLMPRRCLNEAGHKALR